MTCNLADRLRRPFAPAGVRRPRRQRRPGLPPGPLDLSALFRFRNAAGVPAFASASVEPTDAEPILPGSIRGTVVEGSNLQQPNLDVILADPSGVEKARARTTPGGVFTFADFAPGKYKLSATKPESLTRAAADVTITPGIVATPTLELLR